MPRVETIERISPGTLEWELYHATHEARYLQFAAECKGKEVLDAACGTGYGTRLLANAGSRFVTGIDYSQEAIDTAKSRFPHPNASYVTGDCLSLPFADECFDAVYSFETIEHLHSPAEFLAEIKRVLRPGGSLFLSCPNALTRTRHPTLPVPNPHHHSEMTLSALFETISPHFTVTSAFHQSPAIDQVTARHMEHLNDCWSRSFLVRAENAIRRALGKQVLRPNPKLPDLQSPLNLSRHDFFHIAPIPHWNGITGPWETEALAFVLHLNKADRQARQ